MRECLRIKTIIFYLQSKIEEITTYWFFSTPTTEDNKELLYFQKLYRKKATRFLDTYRVDSVSPRITEQKKKWIDEMKLEERLLKDNLYFDYNPRLIIFDSDVTQQLFEDFI